MSEERKKDWKAERIAEYARLEKEKVHITQDMDNNPQLIELAYNLKNLEAEIENKKAPFIEKITQRQQQQTGIKLELTERWDSKDKTFQCPVGIATLRITRSLNIRSREKLIAFLELNKKLTEFIKGFEVTKLRKIKDAGFLGDDIVSYDEKQSIAINLMDADLVKK